jgi:ribulose-5-phosphate 4-epimerase/fuculose-1-phosphate aldolase
LAGNHPEVSKETNVSTKLDAAIRDVVIANRILAHERVVDAYGHVSTRHPDKPDQFLLSRSRSPELVTADDIMFFTLDGKVVGSDSRPPYLERFIHAGVYRARPEIGAVVHSHAEEVLPFSISLQTKLRPVIHVAGCIGQHVPVWDIRDKFGDTNMLVVNEDQGRDLAATLANNNVALMRGHGFAAAGRWISEVVRIAIYLRTNAKVYMDALKLGEVKGLSPGEIDQKEVLDPTSPANYRAWEYWAKRAGCGDMLGPLPG